MLPWHAPDSKATDPILDAVQQDLTTNIPALLELLQSLPPLDTLREERLQWAYGKGAFSHIERVQQITPKAQTLQDLVELSKVVKQIKDACSGDKVTVKRLKAKLAKAKMEANTNANAGQEKTETLR